MSDKPKLTHGDKAVLELKFHLFRTRSGLQARVSRDPANRDRWVGEVLAAGYKTKTSWDRKTGRHEFARVDDLVETEQEYQQRRKASGMYEKHE